MTTTNADILKAAADNATELDHGAFADTELDQTDLDAIAKIESLESIGFMSGEFETYAPLAALPNLRKLAINHWSRDDLSSVGEITQLVELEMEGNEQYRDIEFVATLVNLEVLDLEDGQFTDLAPVSSLSKLRVLNLTNCDEIEDISPLSSLSNLEDLSLNSVEADDIAPLANLKKLRRLDLRGTGVTDLGPLAGMNLGDGLLLDEDGEYENHPG